MNLVNIKSLLRGFLGTFPFLINLYRLNHNKLVVDKNTDLCIEGYPRSANTFSFFLIDEATQQKLKIAHHLHMSGQLVRAIRLKIPAILIIRNPVDAALSFILREQSVSLSTAFYWYERFHSNLLKYMDQLIVCNFNMVVQKPDVFIKYLNSKIPNIDFSSELDLKNIFSLMAQSDRQFKSDNLILGSTRPNKEKNEKKKSLLHLIQQSRKLNNQLQKCEILYSRFSSK